MSFVFVEFALLLLLATGLGGLLGWRLAQRQFADARAEQLRVQQEWSQWRLQIDRRLSERPAPDWTPLMHRLSAIEKSISSIRLPVPEPTNLRPVLDALALMRVPAVPAVNLEPLHARLLALEESIRHINIPAPKETDRTPVLMQLATVETAVRNISVPALAGAAPDH